MITSIIDLAHWEAGMDLKGHHDGSPCANIVEAAKQGLAMAAAKTGQGIDSPDPSFGLFRDQAKQAGVIFADYFFPTNQHSGKEQAAEMVKLMDQTGVALFHAIDWEDEPDHGHTATLQQVEELVSEFVRLTGRYPVIYSYWHFILAHNIPSTSILTKCDLWLAAYGERPSHAPAPWKVWKLWQYTDVKDGPSDQSKYPRVTPGLGRKVDRSCWDGDLASLREWCRNTGWPTCQEGPSAT